MRRSNSSGWPVSSACTGASKPSVCADFGTSCTWPSVIMMTPASRSGGVLASALLRSVKRLVPEAASPVGFDEETQRTCRLSSAASLVSSSRRMAAVCSGRPAMVWLVLSSRTTMAMLARLSRSSCRSVGLESASSSAASDSARNRAPRLRRTSSSATSTTASAAPPRTRGPAPSARNRSTSCSLHSDCLPLPACGERVRGEGQRRHNAGASVLPLTLTLSPGEEAWGEGITAPASPAWPARAPDRSCSCRSART